MIEQIFNKRYHLEDRLGEGGTAIVWSGMDALLRRRVAVKVLRLQYAGDAEFIRRFYHEAESAARLSHPNVVSVYDVGREGETYYIVMELVDGNSLSERIAKEGALSERLTVELALQMCSGLGYAHRQNILHRDIKTANILLTRDDIVKISDFGIARAVERNTLVMTQQGHFLGSVAYLSPEQAQDHELTPASDLYSLGVVLYEMLAGQLPFTGETPIAVALKHINDAPPALPGAINPALAAIVMQLLEKDPLNRYASADELAAALRSVRDLASSVAPREALTMDASTVTAKTKAIPNVPNPPPRKSPMPDRPKAAGGDDAPQPRSPLIWVLIALGALACGVLGFLSVGHNVNFGSLGKPPVTVPSVLGSSLAQAEQTLQAAGLNTHIQAQASDTVPAEHIISEDPGQGSQIAPGSTVTLTVSNGYPIVDVPDVVAFSADDARRLLDQAHMSTKIVRHFSAKVAKDTVISQDPQAHRRVRSHGTVTLNVSDGPQPVNVPNLISQNVDAARVQLKKLGLVLNITEQTPSDAIPAGTIASQDPASGAQTPVGSTVSVVVSAGASMENVPQLTGMKASDAVNALQSAGFIPKISYSVTSDGSTGSVIGQNPGEGSSVHHGSTIEMVVAVPGIVPDVSGMTLDEARTALTNAGYVVGNIAETQEGADGKVARTEPAAGVNLRPGESVEIYQNITAPDTQVTPG